METETACESFVWHDTSYTTSGTYTYAYTNNDGCASTDTLHLTITNTDHTDYTDEACDSYTWNGETYTQSGDYTQTFTNTSGCDSVVTLHLTIHYPVAVDVEITTADSCYEWNSEIYCETGDYTQTFPAANGCDSTVTLHLTITVGVDDHELPGIEVYPNPTSSTLNIKGQQIRRISIYNTDGKLVYSTDGSTSGLKQVDVSRFAAGQYYVKVTLVDNRDITKKVIIKRR